LYVEKPTIVYTEEAITNLAKIRFQEMQIELGNILEPIAPFSNSRDKRAWSGLLKVHLKHLNTDGKQLLCGLRVFSL
jgi:hypothetical protein